MMKHGSFIATEKTVKAQQTRADGLSLTEEGYISNFRFGSQQSVTRNWHMPMHQTDTLFHKAKAMMAFIFGGEADNHAVNTIHARPAAQIMALAGQFNATVILEKDGFQANARELLSLLALDSPQGARLVIKTSGPEAREAAQAIAGLFARKFGES